MANIPHLFCRYKLIIDDEYLSPYEQAEVLRNLRGKLCSHHKANPSDEDCDTRLVMPRDVTVDNLIILSWYIDLHITSRTQQRYDSVTDQLVREQQEVAEDKVTKFVALPELGVVAIDDSTGERNIGGWAAAQRFRSVFRTIPGGRASIDFSGTNADVERALQTWGLSRVDYSLRTFNPTPRSPGDRLEALLRADGAARMTGSVKGYEGRPMEYAEGGFIREAWGLASNGYGQIGVKGTTPQGLQASFRKPTFSDERSKNLSQQEKPRQLRVFVPDHPDEAKQEGEVVKALLEFYGRTDETS